MRWSVLPRIEAAGLWAQTGARTFAVWLARSEDVRTRTAQAEARTARVLRDHLPAVGGRCGPVTDNVNQAKGDQDPSTWRPPRAGARCAYSKWWIHTKYSWGLHLRASEKTALQSMLNTCSS